MRSINEPIIEQDTSNFDSTRNKNRTKGPAGQQIRRLKSGSRKSRDREFSRDVDMSRERVAQYTLSDLEKKVNNYEKRKKRKLSKEKRSRK